MGWYGLEQVELDEAGWSRWSGLDHGGGGAGGVGWCGLDHGGAGGVGWTMVGRGGERAGVGWSGMGQSLPV